MLTKELRAWLESSEGMSEEAVDYFEESARDSVWELNSSTDSPDRDEALDNISTLAEIARYLLKRGKRGD